MDLTRSNFNRNFIISRNSWPFLSGVRAIRPITLNFQRSAMLNACRHFPSNHGHTAAKDSIWTAHGPHDWKHTSAQHGVGTNRLVFVSKIIQQHSSSTVNLSFYFWLDVDSSLFRMLRQTNVICLHHLKLFLTFDWQMFLGWPWPPREHGSTNRRLLSLWLSSLLSWNYRALVMEQK